MNEKSHKIIVVTPAGRKKYLQVLSKYILKDNAIDEWHLWDNCRNEQDRIYINSLMRQFPGKIKVVTESNTDGTNASINRFFKYTRDENCFYIRIDDDVIFLPSDFAISIYQQALLEKEKYTFWAPVIINNAVCTYFLKLYRKIKTNVPITLQALCPMAWGNPIFAEKLHNLFLHNYSNLDLFKIPDTDIPPARFSVNVIGFWGELSKKMSDDFCPLGVDEEDYLTATLPFLTKKPGRLVGSVVVAHFSFFTQEKYLLQKTNILEKYAKIANVQNFVSQKDWSASQEAKKIFKQALKMIANQVFYFYSEKQKNISISLN